MYRRSTPTAVFAFVLAIVAGTLFAIGSWVGGIIATVIAIGLLASWVFYDKDETEGLY